MSIRKFFRPSSRSNVLSNRPAKQARRNSLRKRLLGHEPLEDRRLLVAGAFDVPPIVAPGTGFDGVVAIDFDNVSTSSTLSSSCTGTLLTTGMHILTAAHCVTDNTGAFDVNNLSIVFEMLDQHYVFPVSIAAATTDIPVAWDGVVGNGADLAVIELPSIAPFPAERFDVYRSTNELNDLYVVAGYGLTGTGAAGQIDGSGDIKRIGHNEVGRIRNLANGPVIDGDFDDGTAGNNTLGDSLGLDDGEAATTGGDSGSAAFIDDGDGPRIAGINSFSNLDNTFGDIDTFTRVSSFTGFIDGVLDATSDITLDMNLQPAGNDGVADTITYRVDPTDDTRVQLLIGQQEIWSDLASRVTSLSVIGSGDDDRMVVDYRNGDPVSAGGFSFDGGDPTAGSDTFVVTGTNGDDTFDATIVDSDSADLVVNAGAAIDVDNVESLQIDGNHNGTGDDTLNYKGIAFGDNRIVFTAGSQPDAGLITGFDFLGGGPAHLPLEFLGFGNDGTVDIDSNDPFSNTVLVLQGTSGSDTIAVTGADGDITLSTPSGGQHLDITTQQFATLLINALGDDDVITIDGEVDAYDRIVVSGGDNGDGSDTLNFDGSGDDVTLNLATSTITETGMAPVNFRGLEHINLDAATGDLVVTGTADNDNFSITPLGGGNDGRFTHNLSPGVDFAYDGAATVTFADVAGGDGTDTIELLGDAAMDTVMATASTITVDASTVTVGAGLEVLKLHTSGGDDDINLTGFTNGGAAMNVEIHAGIGDDTVRGSDLDDVIYGGAGNDILIGGIGSDTQYGEAGNDIFGNPSLAADGVADDPGQDFNFGGSGFDNFIWEPGDGPDVNNGGDDGADIFRFFGNDAANAFTLRAGGTPTHFNALIGALVIDNHGIEDVRVDGLGGGDTFTVNDLFETEVVSINLLLGAADGATDAVTVNGRTTVDALQITTAGDGNVGIKGLRYDIHLNQAELANDTLTVNGNEGNDSIHVEDGVATVLTSMLNGNLGDDRLSGAFNTADGGDGDDFIRGSTNDQLILGGAGEDTMIGGPGADTFDGGTGFDTILVEGTTGDDRIDVRQDDATTLRHEVGNTVNGFDGILGGAGTEIDTLGINTVEQVRITAGEGDDTIRVAHDDALVATGVAADMLRITVDGGAPGASDRLTVVDDGAGDTTIQRIGQTDGEGSFTMYAYQGGNPANPIVPLPPVVYSDIEYAGLHPVLPVTGGTGDDGNGRLFVFKYDPFEQNQSLPTATFLGAGSALNLDPNIDPGVDAEFDTPGDEDWYRVVADRTGTLDFQVYFHQQDALANGRAGLPGAGDLDIAVFDADGLVNGVPLAIAGNGAFGTNDADDDERVRIPAVAGQTYYLRVVGAGLPDGDNPNASPAVNAYNVSVTNDAPATPFDLELADNLTILTGDQEVPAVATNANGTANFQYDAVANTFDLDLFVSGLELADTTDNPELVAAHIHRAGVGVNGPVIVTLSAGVAGWVQEPSGIRLRLDDAPFSAAAADIAALSAGDTYINVHSTANPGGEVRGQIDIQNVLGISDSGRSQFDNVTQDNTPTILLRLDDALLLNDLPGNATGTPDAVPPDQTITIPHLPSTAADPVGLDAGYRVAIYDETHPHNPVLLGFAQPIAGLNGVYSFTFTTPLAEGSHFISGRVQMIDPADNDADNATLTPATGYGPRGVSLEIIVDTAPPPVSFGDAAVLGDGLHPDSDSGDAAVPASLVDRITNDATPTFFGRAEADSIVRLYVDVDGNSVISPPDVLIGQTVAVSTDGTNQSPNGEWQITSTVNMNDPNRLGALGVDGERKILVQAEDQAGNLSGNGLAFELDIFLDTRGPQVTEVFITDRPDFDIFTVKPDTPEPTPRVDSLTINVQDLPARVAGFLYPAISNLAVIPNVLPLGLVTLVGDHSGIIAMDSVTFTSDGDLNTPGVQPLAAGNPATGFITLHFAQPLPDDRFMLTLSDSIIDPAGNALDGESNASEPVGTPLFPSGDGLPGGDFVARFTVDSRPEVGVWSQERVYVDINGNLVWDPEGEDNDATNRDFIYHFGTTTDAYFAGNFAPAGAATASGFDKMGTFGRFNGQYEFFIDTDDDGIGDTVGAMFFQVNVLPVAGDFDPAHPGDEIGGFDGQNWYLDVNGDNLIDGTERFATDLRGIPVVGDFNGDGNDDLATFNNDTGQFQFDLDRNGSVDDTLSFFFSGFGEKPVAGDVNLDGIDDIVLWVPNRDGQLPQQAGEFHFLVSDNPAAFGALPVLPPAVNALPSDVFDDYSPAPLGNDLISQFGDEFALPILGNFDPPVGDVQPLDTSGWFTNLDNPLDVDGSGDVTPYDALLVINSLNRGITSAQPSQALRVQQAFDGRFLDVDGNRRIDPTDVLQIINDLNRRSRSGGLAAGGQGEAAPATAASYAAAVDTVFRDEEDEDDSLLEWSEYDSVRNTL